MHIENVMHAYIKHATSKVWGRGEACHDDGEGDTGSDTGGGGGGDRDGNSGGDTGGDTVRRQSSS